VVGDLVEQAGGRVVVKHSVEGILVNVLRSPGENVAELRETIRRTVGAVAVETVDVPISEVGLQARLKAAGNWASRVLRRTEFAIDGDEVSGVGTIVVETDDSRRQLEEAPGRPGFVRVEVGPIATVSAQIWAGESTSSCTLGFAVVKSGTRYTSTAGHCPASDTYQWGGTLSLAYSQYFGSVDLMLYHKGSHTVTNKLWDGSSVRSITSTRSRTAMAVGNFVCHFGQSTGYQCGYITSKSYSPPYVPNVAATWIRIEGCSVGNSNVSLPGDSGGPWFLSATAYGWHSGGVGPNSCGQNDAIVMASNYVSGLAGSILLVP
jgi:hypothetical protein